MPSRSNPNTPTSSKPKTARVLKSKRVSTLRRNTNVKSRVTKVPRTSQAMRQAALPSRKRAKKMEQRSVLAARRIDEEREADAEAAMRDVREGKRSGKVEEGEKMEVDEMR